MDLTGSEKRISASAVWPFLADAVGGSANCQNRPGPRLDPSVSWCYAWSGRAPIGVTGGCMGNCWVLGVKVAASTVWEVLQDAGIDPAPWERRNPAHVSAARSADALLACDFLDTVTLTGTRMYMLAVIEHRTRRIRILGATAHLTASWVTQAARNLVMDLEDAGCRARFLIRDRDGKYPGLFDAVLADAGIGVVLTGVRMPRMNAAPARSRSMCRATSLAASANACSRCGERRAH
jgi:hypothetical protein